jgi:hypothetical protein
MDTQDLLTNFMEMMKASNDSLRADMINNDNMIKNNQDFSNKIELLQAKIELRSKASRASSRAVISRHLAVSPNATIPVTIAPIIVPVLKTPLLCSTATDIVSSPTPIEPMQFLANTTSIETLQPFETVLDAPVRTTVYNIAPSAKSNHSSEETPMDDNSHMDADEYIVKESVIFCDFNDQLTYSTQKLEYPYPILIEDNSCDNNRGYFSGDCNAASSIFCEVAHDPITMVLAN